MRNNWVRELVRFSLFMLGALVLGALVDNVGVVMLLVLLGYITWLLYWLYRLEYWLVRERRAHPPEASGLWGEIFDELYRHHRRNRQRKLRIARLIRAFRNSTAAMPDGVVALNRHWQIVWFNDAGNSLLGLSRQQDVGQHILNLLRSPAFVTYVESGSFSEAVEIASPVDHKHRLSLRIVPYGEGERLLLVRDVTRLHRLEQMRREFVANASHELRSPLTVISGYLEALAEDGQLAGEWREPVSEMRRQAERMANIVSDLLELSRLETADEQMDDAEIDVGGLIARIREEALLRGEGPSDVRILLESPVNLRGVEKEIYSAFSNLVFNAMRYTPREGHVEIRWYQQGGRPCLAVIDTGVGIAQEHIPRLTERFYRADSSRLRATGGTGLGLAIVKHVMQRHGARLDISSTPGAGSTFTCVFPAERSVERR